MNEWLIDVVGWAWERHHNELSWYIRPLFLLPFCYFAYRRNGWGIAATLLALMSSIAWFPAPEVPSPEAVQMLRVEQDHLLGEWSVGKVAIALLVPLMFGGIAAALWRRSFGWALVVINGGVLFKIVWTYVVDGDGAGASAHLPPALIGLAVVDVALVAVAHHLHRRTSGAVAVEAGPGTVGADRS